MGDWLCHALPISARRRFATRMLDGMPGDKLQLHPILEGRSLIRQRLSSLGTEENLHRRNEAFQREISDNELGSADVVIGFDTSSWLLSRRVKRMNGKFILDQSIGHPIEKERIFNSLRDRYPQWMTTIPRKADTHIAEEIEEQKLADLIVVPSSFVRSTLTSQGIPHAKIRVIPFGTDLDFFRPDEASRPADPVIFLFVGSISARKGVPVLLEAWRHIRVSNAELWLVGPGPIPSGEASQLPSSIRFLGRKSRPEVAKLMRLAHALVFPSFFEGLAQVQIEALASGLPVISTREAGAEDVIRDGENGFLVPAGDVTALSERVQELATNRDLLHAMQRTVVAERDRLSWSIYGDRWVKVLDELA